jgi:hypothetical protein
MCIQFRGPRRTEGCQSEIRVRIGALEDAVALLGITMDRASDVQILGSFKFAGPASRTRTETSGSSVSRAARQRPAV